MKCPNEEVRSTVLHELPNPNPYRRPIEYRHRKATFCFKSLISHEILTTMKTTYGWLERQCQDESGNVFTIPKSYVCSAQ